MKDDKITLKMESEHMSMGKECYEYRDDEVFNRLCIVHFQH